MPTFALTARSPAPVEEVWKLLHDPTRFPEWWEGVRRSSPARTAPTRCGRSGYPDFPMAQLLETGQRARAGDDLVPGLRPGLPVAAARGR